MVGPVFKRGAAKSAKQRMRREERREHLQLAQRREVRSHGGREAVEGGDPEPRPSPRGAPGRGSPPPPQALPPGHKPADFPRGGGAFVLLQHSILREDRGRWLFTLDSVA